MTPAPMIAVMVIIIACTIGIIITMIFGILDHFEKKNCSHFCKVCKYRHKCDYYQNKK